MEPIIEIIIKNVMYNNSYDRHTKNEFINTINRITLTEKLIEQYKRSSDYVLLFNILHEEKMYLSDRKTFFYKKFNKDIKDIVSDYIESVIGEYSSVM